MIHISNTIIKNSAVFPAIIRVFMVTIHYKWCRHTIINLQQYLPDFSFFYLDQEL
ncbi:hypothetical protein B0H34DRAFT_721445, partial [Crassisporium funariophilum]